MAGRKYPRLVIRSSAIHAAGCYTLDAIRKGQRICEYDGPRMEKAVADERYADRYVTYLFGYGSGEMVIDGFGTAMFINHCCSPNCETEEMDERIYMLALRDIAAGEELTFEYNLYDSGRRAARLLLRRGKLPGTMFAKEEVARRAALGIES